MSPPKGRRAAPGERSRQTWPEEVTKDEGKDRAELTRRSRGGAREPSSDCLTLRGWAVFLL